VVMLMLVRSIEDVLLQAVRRQPGKQEAVDKNAGKRVHCKEISIYVFPEKELRGLSPSLHIHESVCDLYIPTIGPPIQKHECRNWDCGRAVAFLGIYVSNVRYSIFAVW
jgi:hypothetical protein